MRADSTFPRGSLPLSGRRSHWGLAARLLDGFLSLHSISSMQRHGRVVTLLRWVPRTKAA